MRTYQEITPEILAKLQQAAPGHVYTGEGRQRRGMSIQVKRSMRITATTRCRSTVVICRTC